MTDTPTPADVAEAAKILDGMLTQRRYELWHEEKMAVKIAIAALRSAPPAQAGCSRDEWIRRGCVLIAAEQFMPCMSQVAAKQTLANIERETLAMVAKLNETGDQDATFFSGLNPDLDSSCGGEEE